MLQVVLIISNHLIFLSNFFLVTKDEVAFNAAEMYLFNKCLYLGSKKLVEEIALLKAGCDVASENRLIFVNQIFILFSGGGETVLAFPCCNINMKSISK